MGRKASKETASAAIALAEKHKGNQAAMQSSADLCLSDAYGLLEQGDYLASTDANGAQFPELASEKYYYATRRALDSVEYAANVFHADAEAIRAMIGLPSRL